MFELTATNPKQLDICLRLLFAESVPQSVRLCETENKKRFVYKVTVYADEEKFKLIAEKFRVLTT